MTDSMKFGPEWLRNMATDTSNNQNSSGVGGSGASGGGGIGGGVGGVNSSTSSSTNSNTNGTSNSYQFGQHQQNQHQQMPQQQQLQQVRGLFPEFRYGREEMLSLFNKNCTMPEILPSFKKLFVEKVQYPLALTPSTEEEIFTSIAPTPTQRPQWLQRSPVAFNAAPRGTGRGGSMDRGRMRGKSIYHPIFPRPTPMFEDEARNLKPERGWVERNGATGDGSSVSGGGPDWSISPSSSPRKDFTSHPARNLENWRRSRHDEEASGGANVGSGTSGPPIGSGSSINSGLINSGGGSTSGGDGWRGSGTNNFGNSRWGRSTSWRDDDGGNSAAVDGNAYNIPQMQRSYSTIGTSERAYFSGLSKSSSLTSSTGVGGGGGGGSLSGGDSSKPSSNNRHHHQSSGISHQWETEDMLPEWAMENPTDSGGTFDASGAFHGSLDEDEEKRRLRSGSGGAESGSSSTSSSSSVSNRKKSSSNQDDTKKIALNKKGQGSSHKDQGNTDATQSNKDDTESEMKYSNNQPTSEVYSKEESSSSTTPISNKFEPNDGDGDNLSETPPSINSSASPSQLSSQNTSTPNSSTANSSSMQQCASSHKIPLVELSDRMQEVADDMVEKLIMDDDNESAAAQASSAKQEQKPSTNNPTIPPGQGTPQNVTAPQVATNASKVTAAMYKNQSKPPMFLPVVDPMLQQRHLQQQTAAVAAINAPPEMSLPPIPKPNTELWYYRDPQSKVQGPFTAMEMIEWYRAGYFDENLYVRRMCDSRFAALGDLIKLCGQMPFQSSHLIPPLQSTEIPIIPHQQQQQPHDPIQKDAGPPPNAGIVVNGPHNNDLKGSVTATADALSGAVKNMINPMEASHVLNAHFQMLQEQYIRHQEMMVLAEFSTKDSFNRLPPNEKTAIVRQKVHLLGLPEHLTSFTGLSNSLASLNPQAGNQLYGVIAEYSKKDIYEMSPLEAQLQQFQHQHLQHQQQQQQQHQQQQQQHQQQVQQQQQQAQTFLEQDDYIQQQTQQLQQQQLFQNVGYRSAFDGSGGGNSTTSGEEQQINAELLNELNLRMMLRQGNLRSGRTPHPPPNDFGAEILSRAAAGPQAVMTAMIPPQWPQHIIQHGQMPPQQTSQQPQQQQQPTPQQQQPQTVIQSQWPILAGPGTALPQQQQLQASVVGKPPTVALWTNASDPAMLIQQQLTQQQPQPVDIMHHNIENKFVSMQQQQQPSLPQQTFSQPPQQHQDSNSNIIMAKLKEDQTILVEKNANVPNVPMQEKAVKTAAFENNVENNKNKSNDKSQCLVPQEEDTQASTVKQQQQPQLTANVNKRNGKQQKSSGNEKLLDSSNNKKASQIVAPATATEEERRKEAVEEKRRHKEEKKRQQLEEEKKRLQLIEEEKRRQASEEKERQKEIHAHRRKAMLSSASGGESNSPGGKPGGNGNAMSKQERLQSSVAPWSTNTNAASASSPGPSLAEIQKAERRERRADQQRLMELMDKQMRIAAAAEASDNVLKWNAAPVAVKSLAEIQAEEAKRLASDQAAIAELQRRKEQEQASSTAANSTSSSNPFAMIWSSKVWGATNSTSGFWEEPVKFPSNSSSGTASTAASVAKATSNVSTNKQMPSATFASSVVATGGNRQLSKSQTVSNMVSSSSSPSNWTNVNNNNPANSKQQSVLFNKQQQAAGNSNAASNDKGKNKVSNKTITGSISSSSIPSSQNSVPSSNVGNNNVNKPDDFRSEFNGWCTKTLNNMNTKIDVPTFVTFLQDLESPFEVKDYVRMYLGESKEFTEFAKQFLERRSKYKNLQRAQNAHIDDMCKPAPAINPSGNDSFDNKGKQKKIKKSKMTKLDARILGFSVTAAEGRINVGDRDYVDNP